jgi:hypothetical protein
MGHCRYCWCRCGLLVTFYRFTQAAVWHVLTSHACVEGMCSLCRLILLCLSCTLCWSHICCTLLAGVAFVTCASQKTRKHAAVAHGAVWAAQGCQRLDMW